MHPIETKNDHLENVSILSNMAILGMLKSQGVFFQQNEGWYSFPAKKTVKKRSHKPRYYRDFVGDPWEENRWKP